MKKGGLDSRPFPFSELAKLLVLIVLASVREDGRQHRGAFRPHSIQALGIKSQKLQDGWSYLSSLDEAMDGLRMDVRVRDQQHDVSIIPRVAAVLGLLFVAAGIDHADVWNYHDVRSARVAPFAKLAAGTGNVGNAGWVKEGVQRGAIVDLAQSDRRAGILESSDCSRSGA